MLAPDWDRLDPALQSGDALGGPNREAFLHLPDQDRMHESVVEMQFPLRAA